MHDDQNIAITKYKSVQHILPNNIYLKKYFSGSNSYNNK